MKKGLLKSKLINKLGLLAVFAVALVYSLMASSSGYTGSSSTGCSCHGSNNSNTTFSLSSETGSFTVQKGSTTKFTLRISNSNYTRFGTNIAVKDASSGGNISGTVKAITGLKVSSSELTHNNGFQSSSNNYFDFEFEWTAPNQAGTYYVQAVGNAVNGNSQSSGDQPNLMSAVSITVEDGPSITVTSPNGGENYCVATTQEIKWTSSGVSLVKIELSTNGGSTYPTEIATNVPAGNGSYQWVIPGSQPSTSQARIRITSMTSASVNDVSNANFTLSGSPIINQQPTNQVTCTGRDATFSVMATGGGVNYQWKKDGQNLSGKTASTLLISGASIEDAGEYTCEVKNQCGVPTLTEVATLTVLQGTFFSKQPEDKTVCQGQQVVLSTTVMGDGVALQWQKDGQDIPMANAITYTIQSSKVEDSGVYRLKVTNSACNTIVYSEVANVVVNAPPAITQQPIAAEACEGEEVTLSVQATGGNLTYTWLRNNEEVPNSNNPNLKLTDLTANQAGKYKVRIVGSCSPLVTSDEIDLKINLKPTITQQPTDLSAVEGSQAIFTLEATGEGLSYKWQKDGNDLDGAESNILVISSLTQANAGTYACIVSNDCGELISRNAVLTVTQAAQGPSLGLNATTLDFGDTEVGASKDRNVIVINNGDEELVVTAVELDMTFGNSNHFQIMGETEFNLAPSASKTIAIRIIAQEEGTKTAKVLFASNSPENPELTLNANVIPASGLEISLSTINFGNMGIDEDETRQFTIKNNSADKPITIESVTIQGDTEFELIGNQDLGFVLNPQESSQYEVKFRAERAGTFSALISFKTADKTQQVSLEATVNPSSVEFAESNILAIPNPSGNGFELEFGSAYGVANIFNENGLKVAEINVDNGRAFWNGNLQDNSKAPNGTYTVVLTTNLQEVLQTRVIIVR